jgi:hypothetical protein
VLGGALGVTGLASSLSTTLPLHAATMFGWCAARSEPIFVLLSASPLLSPAVGRACVRFVPSANPSKWARCLDQIKRGPK